MMLELCNFETICIKNCNGVNLFNYFIYLFFAFAAVHKEIIWHEWKITQIEYQAILQISIKQLI